MPAVNSSMILWASYDPSARRLSIGFRESGERYDYHGVPAAVYEGLLQARSKGTYFNDHIRDRYRFDRRRH